MSAKVAKSTLQALERVFAAEIEGRLPFQAKGRIYDKLVSDGLLDRMETKFGSPGVFAVTVRGYQLSHLGRLLYCTECSREPAAAP